MNDEVVKLPGLPTVLEPMAPRRCAHGMIVPLLENMNISTLQKRLERARGMAQDTKNLIDSMNMSPPFSSDVAPYGKRVVDEYWAQRGQHLLFLEHLRLDLIELAGIIEDLLQERRIERAKRTGFLLMPRKPAANRKPVPANGWHDCNPNHY